MKFLLVWTLFVSLCTSILFSSAVYSAPGEIRTQFSVNNVTGDGRTPSTIQGVEYHHGFLWVTDFATDRIYRVYPETVYNDDDTVKFNPGDSDLNIPLTDANDPPVNSDNQDIRSCFTDVQGNKQYCGGGGLTYALNYLWNASPVTDDIIKIDPVDGDNLETENTLANLAFPSPTDMAYDGRHFWIVDWQSNTINKVLPEDGSLINSIPGPSSLPTYDPRINASSAHPFGITWDGKALWVSDQEEDKIYRVNPDNGDILNVFDSPGSNPKGLAWDGDSLWHVDQRDNLIYKLDSGVIPVGVMGCVEKNGRTLRGEVLLSQQTQSDQTVSMDGDGCFVFSSFTSGTPLKVVINEGDADEKPIITLTEVSAGVVDVVLNLGQSYVEPGFTAIDAEDGDVSANVVAVPDVINAPSLINTSSAREYTVTYDVVDSAGNLADTKTRKITVLAPDTTPPVITLLGSNNLTIEQGSTYQEPGATATDDRDGDVTANILRTGTVNTNVAGRYTLSYNVSDAAGNRAVTVTRIVTVSDSTVPVITLQGANPVTLEKGTAYTEPGFTATDSVDGNLNSSVVRTGTIPNAVGSYVLSYNVTDSSGNRAATVTRTVNVIDTTNPQITLLGSSPMNVERDSVFVDPGVRAIDPPSEDISSRLVIGGSVNTAVVGSYTLTYNVSDASGNSATQVSRVVNVVDSGPVITLNGANPVNHSVNTPYVDSGATAYDSVDGDLTASIVSNSNVNVTTIGTYSVTYNVRDSDNNPAPTVTRIVNVNDFSAPVITLLGTSPMNIERGVSFTDPGATAFDNADGDLTASIIRTGSVNTSVSGNYVLRYSVSDSSGNPALMVTRTVIVADTQAPVITLNGDANINHELGKVFTDPGATALDAIDGNVPVTISGSVNVNTAGTYILRYDARDSSGNAATQVRRNVTVVNGPSITLLGNNPVNHQINTPFTDPGANAFDTTDGDITSSISVSGTVNTAVAGSYNLVYNVRNSANISAQTVTRIVNVGDFIPPVITLLGASSVNVEQGTSYVDEGATASDNIDGNITNRIQRSGTVNTNTSGVYNFSFNVADSAGNAAQTVTRTIVVADNIAPTLVLNGVNPMMHEVGTSFRDPGATANDTYTGDISNRIRVSGVVNSSVPGTYTLTYSVTDLAGNAAPSVTRTVIVADTQAPTLLLNGAANMNHGVGTPFTDPGATATDRFEGNITSRIRVTGSVNPNVAGVYTLRYDVSDSAGNAAPSLTRRVTVGDFTAPVITRIGEASITLYVGASYADAGATATDNVDGNLTPAIITTNPVNTAVAGVYTIRYNVTDLAGNSAQEVTRRVQVVADTTPPVITLNGASRVNVDQGTLFNDPGATASDNIDGNITSRIAVTGSVNVSVAGTYTLTYRVSDSAGNTAVPVVRSVEVVARPTVVVQAETGSLSGLFGLGPQVQNSQPGYTGSGYVNISSWLTRSGDYIEMTNVSAYAIPYNLNVRYANANAGVIEVRLNGTAVGSISLSSTGSDSNWRKSASLTVTPRQGTNTIRLVVLDKDGNIDAVNLEPR